MMNNKKVEIAKTLTLFSSSGMLGVSLLLLATTIFSSPFLWSIFIVAIIFTAFFTSICYAANKKLYLYQVIGLIIQSLLLAASWWFFGIGKSHVFWLYVPAILFIASISAIWLLYAGKNA